MDGKERVANETQREGYTHTHILLLFIVCLERKIRKGKRIDYLTRSHVASESAPNDRVGCQEEGPKRSEEEEKKEKTEDFGDSY